jgi:homoserine O-acetyltransferase
MDSFEFESGAVLEDVAVEYVTRGVPKYDDEGNITNAIVYCPTLKGGYSIFDQHKVSSEDYEIINDYFFIKIMSLGAPDSCSPSSTGLRYDFPSYTFKDRVNFKKQFLKEKFQIDTVFGIIGEGLGGFEVYTWACEYPDDMEFFMVINSSFKTYGYRHVFLRCIESILETSDDIYSEVYSPSFSKMSVAIFKLMFAGYFPKMVLENLSADEIDALMDDYVDEALFMDIHDFHARTNCILNYNLEDKLSNIKAKALIFGIRGFLLFNPESDAVPLADVIKDSTVKVFDSKRNDYYDEDDYSELLNELVSFLKNLKK